MVRTASYDINGVKKGGFSPEEDDKLKGFIERNNGPGKWLQLPRLAGLSRTGKSCRLRWMNYLRPNVKRGNYTEEEDDLIIKLQEEIGNKWCVIASNLPGRTDNDIKNHWHTKLKKKRVMRNAIASKEVEKDQSIEPYVFESSNKNKKKEGQEHKTVDVDYDTLNILESSQVSSEPYSSITKAPSSSSEAHELSSAVNMAAVDSAANSSDVFSGLSRDDFWTKPYLADSYWYDDIASTLCTDDEISLMAGMWWMQYTH